MVDKVLTEQEIRSRACQEAIDIVARVLKQAKPRDANSNAGGAWHLLVVNTATAFINAGTQGFDLDDFYKKAGLRA